MTQGKDDKMSMTVMEFCIKHGACSDGQAWALATGEPDMDSLWQRDDIRTEWRIWIAEQPDVLSDRERRLFACWCCRQVWHLLTDERSRQAVVVAELYADGRTSRDELAAAYDAARDVWAAAWVVVTAAASAAASAAAYDAARDVWAAAWAVVMAAASAAADDAAHYAARAAASATAYDAASAAAMAAARTAARAAARTAARDAQAAYLKEHTHPCFC